MNQILAALNTEIFMKHLIIFTKVTGTQQS